MNERLIKWHIYTISDVTTQHTFEKVMERKSLGFLLFYEEHIIIRT